MANDIDALISRLEYMHDNIDDDVDEVLKITLENLLEILL